MRKPQCESFCGKYYGWISFASNIFNAAFKIGVGWVTASHALVADGFHSLSDSLTAIVTIATLKVSGRPSDESHPYGHGKIEFLSACFFSVILLGLAACIMLKSVYSIFGGQLSAPNFLAVGPAVVSILVNIAISNYGLCVGREINSPVVIANAKENRADAFSSIASLAGIVGALMGFPFLDPVAAILVSLLIARMGYEILRDSSAGLMDGAIEKDDRKRIRALAGSVRGVQRVAFLKTRRIGQKTWADLGIEVQPTFTLDEADRIAHEVRNSLMRNFPEMEDAVVYLDSERAGRERRGPLSRLAGRFGFLKRDVTG
ncbi:MAG TPA: cation transporter [Candidatus Hydrogenedentes bacterium]|nr:cation transporter [Candidatus Hydrogenedentota bacterium]